VCSSDLDQELRVHFVQRLRSEKKFASVEELKARISQDVEIGRSILASSQAQCSLPRQRPDIVFAAR